MSIDTGTIAGYTQHMKNKAILFVSILVLLAAAVVVFRSYQRSYQEKVTASETEQVKSLVTEFGTHLKNVPLTAQKELLVPVIKKEYAPFVSQTLLERFEEDPAHAPGRQTSSPWPDRLEVQEVQQRGNYYEVVAQVVNMTSVEVKKGGDAGRDTVYLTVAFIDGTWKIADYQTSME